VAAAVVAFFLVTALCALLAYGRYAAVIPATKDGTSAVLAAEFTRVEVTPTFESQTIASAPTVPEPAPKQPEAAPKLSEVNSCPIVNLPEALGTQATACQQYGTKVNFYDNPAEATKMAAKDQKLLFVLQVAGNFEEPGFT
jgi:hypothetical protein